MAEKQKISNPLEEEMVFDQMEEKPEPKYKFEEIESDDDGVEEEKSDIVKDIRKDLELGKFVLGHESVIKNLKLSKISKVYLSSNIPLEWKKDIEHYCKMTECEVVSLKFNSQEMGVICKKPFVVSAIGILK